MKVPLSLERVSPSTYADGYLLSASNADSLGQIISRLCAEGKFPRLFHVQGGWLLHLPGSTSVIFPGTVRLRLVAPGFFIPVDAELSPAILSDEFNGLIAGRGLVLLPSGSFAFDPNAQLSPTEWLSLPPVETEEWVEFPSPPPLADTLRKIERPASSTDVREILSSGTNLGSEPLTAKIPEDARPPTNSFVRRTAARAALGMAGALAMLARTFGLGGLARSAAKITRKAIDNVPRLSEKVLGEQEAALRELVNQLKSGDIEKALRRAPIAVADPEQTGTLSGSARLNEHGTRFSLSDLLRGGQGGQGSVWAGGGDVWELLREEYRRLAEEAVKRGDYRRAAYLWGVLLRNLRMAVNILRTGGQHRDAAILLRDKLQLPLEAAEAFDKAGDFDEAVKLYEKCGEDITAGDLLRRIGEDVRAEECYINAAAKLAARSQHLQAGDLLREKTGKQELANVQYLSGWQDNRPEFVICGQRLVDDYVLRNDLDTLEHFLQEAVLRLAPPKLAEADRFFNSVLRTSSGILPEEKIDVWRDRIRFLFADHLRDSVTEKSRGGGAEKLFGIEWSASVRRDATFAAAQLPAVPVLKPESLELTKGIVRAVAVARTAGVVFVGTAECITAWEIRTGASRNIAHDWAGELIGLCSNDDGKGSLHLLLAAPGVLRLTAITIGNGFAFGGVLASAEVACRNPKSVYIQPRIFDDHSANIIVIAVDGVRLAFHSGTLSPSKPVPFKAHAAETHWLNVERNRVWDWSSGELIVKHQSNNNLLWVQALGWVPNGGLLLQPCLDWRNPNSSTLILAGVDADGVLHQTEIESEEGRLTAKRYRSRVDCKFSSVALGRGGRQVIAASGAEIFSFYGRASQLEPQGIIARVEQPVAFLYFDAFSSLLVVVCDDGRVTTLPLH